MTEAVALSQEFHKSKWPKGRSWIEEDRSIDSNIDVPSSSIWVVRVTLSMIESGEVNDNGVKLPKHTLQLILFG